MLITKDRVLQIIYAPSFRATALAMLLVALTMIVFTTPAYADILGIGDAINDALASLLSGLLNSMVDMITNLIADLNVGILGMVTNDFSQLFTGNATGATSGMWSLVVNVSDGIIKPIGYSILCFGALLQIVKISQKADLSQFLPTFKEIVFLFLFVAVFYYLISNALEIMTAIYAFVNQIAEWINSTQLVGNSASAQIVIEQVDAADLGVWLVIGLLVVLLAICMIVAYVVALFVGYARAIQLYLLAMFAPIPLSLLIFEETRQWGIGYLKNFIAVCLAGAIMLIMLFAFPFMMVDVIINGMGGSGDVAIDAASFIGSRGTNGAMWQVLSMLVLCLLLIFGLAKSGTWARDILGG